MSRISAEFLKEFALYRNETLVLLTRDLAWSYEFLNRRQLRQGDANPLWRLDEDPTDIPCRGAICMWISDEDIEATYAFEYFSSDLASYCCSNHLLHVFHIHAISGDFTSINGDQ